MYAELTVVQPIARLPNQTRRVIETNTMFGTGSVLQVTYELQRCSFLSAANGKRSRRATNEVFGDDTAAAATMVGGVISFSFIFLMNMVG